MKKFLPKTLKNPSGFTLVELLVVISIIAILSVLGISLYGGVQQKARDTQRRADINAIKAALEQRFNATTGQYSGPLVSTWFANSKIPLDPSTSAAYLGVPPGSVSSFTVCATLEGSGTDMDTGTAGIQVCVYNQQQ